MRKLLPYTTAAVLAVAVYTAWVLYARYEDAQLAEDRAKQRTSEQQAVADRMILKVFGNGLKILNFRADPVDVASGGRVVMCYGVANATKVRIEPAIKPLKPAMSYCMEVFPTRTTTYKLLVEDDKAAHADETLTIHVH